MTRRVPNIKEEFHENLAALPQTSSSNWAASRGNGSDSRTTRNPGLKEASIYSSKFKFFANGVSIFDREGQSLRQSKCIHGESLKWRGFNLLNPRRSRRDHGCLAWCQGRKNQVKSLSYRMQVFWIVLDVWSIHQLRFTLLTKKKVALNLNSHQLVDLLLWYNVYMTEYSSVFGLDSLKMFAVE